MPSRDNPFGAFLSQSTPNPFAEYLDPPNRSGAPTAVRAAVGNAPDADRLATIRQFFPDAAPYQGDNFIFTHPETGKRTLYNPEGLDWGDAASLARMVPQAIGGVAGGLIGMAAPPGAQLATVPTAAALGSQAGGQAYDWAMRRFGGTVDTRTPEQMLKDAAVETATEAVFNKVAPYVGKAVREVGGLGKRALGAAPQASTVAADLTALSVPSEGAAGLVGGRTAQAYENILSKMPLASDVMDEAFRKMRAGLADAFERVRTSYGQAGSREEAGRSLQRGATAYVDSFKQQANKLYDDLSRHIPGDTPIPLSNTTAGMSDLLSQFANEPAIARTMVPRELRGWHSDIMRDSAAQPAKGTTGTPAGALTWDQVKRLRSYVGEMADDPRAISNVPKSQWKGMYAALSDDLGLAAAAQGPDALAAFRKANGFYKAGVNAIDERLNKILGNPAAEDAFRVAMIGDKRGATALRDLRQMVGKDAWGDVVAVKLQELGIRQGEFSPAQFATQWANLPKETKQALVGGTEFVGMKADLDRLVRIAEKAKDSKFMSNPSGTAGQLVTHGMMQGGAGAAGYMLAGDLTGGLTTLAMTVAVPYGHAKLMTSPRFVKWLAQGARVNPTNPAGVSAHLGLLAGIATAEPQNADSILAFVDALGSQFGLAPSGQEATQKEKHE